jgi:hypothetical protein
MVVKIQPTKTGALMIAEALEAQAEALRNAAGGFVPRGQFLLDIAHQIRMQSGNEPLEQPL